MEGRTHSYATNSCREGMFRLIDVSDFHDVQAVPMNARQQAIVLLGPTGSGKTPLGHRLQTNGFQGRPCVHFDFGEHLRQAAARTESDRWMTSADLALLRRVLKTGALLEDEDFPIAHKLLLSFLQQSGAAAHTLVVMNGLPRHAGQAQALAASLDVPAVIVLQCSPEVVLARIASNVGGDRTERADDDVLAIERKLEIFTRRTLPLVKYYRDNGATIIDITVTNTMTAEAVAEAAEAVAEAAEASDEASTRCC